MKRATNGNAAASRKREGNGSDSSRCRNAAGAIEKPPLSRNRKSPSSFRNSEKSAQSEAFRSIFFLTFVFAFLFVDSKEGDALQ